MLPKNASVWFRVTVGAVDAGGEWLMCYYVRCLKLPRHSILERTKCIPETALRPCVLKFMSINQPRTICLVSSSGGHFEQLKMLAPLAEQYRLVWVTEKTDYANIADYYLRQTGLKDYLFPFKMMANLFSSIRIWLKTKPDAVISTGTMVAIPLCLLAKLLKKKVIFIESFARVHDGTRAGKFMYKHADLFIYQWESLQAIYPNGVFGGSIY